MSVNAKMTAIADAIRDKTGGKEKLTLDGICTAIPQVYAAGAADASAECAMEHYTAIAHADANGVTVEIPFVPDVVYINSFDPRFVSKASTFGFVYEPWNIGQYVGFRSRTSGLAAMNISNIKNFLTVQGNRYTFKADATYPWRTEFAYTVMACRFSDRDDNARIRAFFATVTGSESVTLRKEIVEAAFTDDEWQELLAAYPSVTVALV